GNNDGSITVNVTEGNGNYQFRIAGGSWITPIPSDSDEYKFENLIPGIYTIEVRDGFGCPPVSGTATILPQLTASAVLDADLVCDEDAEITINAAGGSGNYTYEWSNDGGSNYSAFTGNVFTTDTD